MKVFFRVRISYIVIFAVFHLGCSTATTTSLKDETGINFSPTPAPKNFNNDEGIILKEKGWQIPSPRKKQKSKIKESIMKSEDGKDIKVTATFYTPIENFIYEENPLDANGEVILVHGKLKLMNFVEIKVEENVFLYTISARKTEAKEPIYNSTSHNHIFGYQIVDRDGDGKFETLLTDGSKFLVPVWALQKVE